MDNKQIIQRLLNFATSALLLVSCLGHQQVEPYHISSDGQSIQFEYRDFERVDIGTRASLSPDVEARILNMYVLIFDANTGKRIYSHFYTSDAKVGTSGDVQTNRNSWYTNSTPPTSSGRIGLSSPDVANGRIYLIANLEDDLRNLTAAQLSSMEEESELLNFVTHYNQPTLERMGLLNSVGYSSVSINGNDITLGSDPAFQGTLQSGRIHIDRMDAKVSFTVGIVPGSVYQRAGKDGQGRDVIFYQRILSFEPVSWCAHNVPMGSHLLPIDETLATRTSSPDPETFGGYPPTKEHDFETATSNDNCGGYAPGDLENSTYLSSGLSRQEYGFSFYTLENKQIAKQSVNSAEALSKYGITGYHLRDKRNKNADGTYSSGEMWEFAPENAEYVTVRGIVHLEQFSDLDPDTKHDLSMAATYTIHLGDFGSSKTAADSRFDNYTINRDTHYHYTINIKGIGDVETEVIADQTAYNRSNEPQSGAAGDVVLVYDNCYYFDAHYDQKVIKFSYDELCAIGDIETLSWYVSSPFGRNGMPDRMGPSLVEVPNGLDYKWVKFVENVGANPTYNRTYPGDNSPLLLDVIQLCDHLRDQVNKYKIDPTTSDFDEDGNLYFTVYVDEFYYNQDPISGEARPSLWHEFTNKPDRILHLMCTESKSIDGASSRTRGVLTIRQKSIQTIYSTAAAEGWGIETVDETQGHLWFFNRSETWDLLKDKGNPLNSVINASGYPSNNAECKLNGLYNSGKLWGLLQGGGNTDDSPLKASFRENVEWSDYLDYNRPDDHLDDLGRHISWLKDDDSIATLRYACMARNRDNDGDGIIGEHEIHWYMASVGQLTQLFIGDLGLPQSARLYNITNAAEANAIGYDSWRCHVISSTNIRNASSTGGSNRPIIIWAEEGNSSSAYGLDAQWGKAGELSVRCVRNLYEDDARDDITDPQDFAPPIASVQANPDGTYTFDLTHTNENSLRIKTTVELPPTDEHSATSRTYKRFQTGPLANEGASYGQDMWHNGENSIYNRLLRGESICPEGYRVPNIREMIVMGNLVTDNSFWEGRKYMVCNSYSFGEFGNQLDKGSASKKSYTWYFDRDRASTDYVSAYIRCVRDVD